MKKFLSTAYSETAFNVATLVLRLTFGLMVLILYGFDKIMHFSNLRVIFPDPLHIGHRWSLVLVIFAETALRTPAGARDCSPGSPPWSWLSISEWPP
jgi:hypothetical protein